MCGDHDIAERLCTPGEGSPPHVRGPLKAYALDLLDHGITPACAGTTKMAKSSSCKGWDHPRMCGDHRYYIRCEDCDEGSPPHVRGPHPSTKPVNEGIGITPACAGTTLCLSSGLLVIWDHPRMCGDHTYQSL